MREIAVARLEHQHLRLFHLSSNEFLESELFKPTSEHVQEAFPQSEHDFLITLRHSTDVVVAQRRENHTENTIAFGMIDLKCMPYPELKLLTVAPKDRRLGIGSLVLSTCEAITLTSGRHTMELTPQEPDRGGTSEHDALVEFYARRGYRLTSQFTNRKVLN